MSNRGRTAGQGNPKFPSTNMNRGGQPAFAQRPPAPIETRKQPAGRGGSRAPAFASQQQALRGPERANVVNSSFQQRRPAGNYGTSSNRSRTASAPTPDVARMINNMKSRGVNASQYGGASGNNSFKEFQRKYIPGGAPEPPQSSFASRFPSSQQAPSSSMPRGMPSESRRYIPMSQRMPVEEPPQPETPFQQFAAKPQQQQAAPQRSGRPTVDLSAFQRPYVKKAQAPPAPAEPVQMPVLDDMDAPMQEQVPGPVLQEEQEAEVQEDVY